MFSGNVMYGERYDVTGDSNARAPLRFERHVTRCSGKDLNLLDPLPNTFPSHSEPFFKLQTPQTSPAGPYAHNRPSSMRRGSCY